MKKSEALSVNLGEEIINTEATYTTRFFQNINVIFRRIWLKIKETKDEKDAKE
jgi:hypothetical protein